MIRRVYSWWLWVYYSRIRNHFCFNCDRSTFRQHNHHAKNRAIAEHLARETWPGDWS